MLDRLPVELVEQIVCLAVPSRNNRLIDQERMRALSTYCLVSKHLTSVSQRLLFSVVELISLDAAERFLEAATAELGSVVRVLGFAQQPQQHDALHVRNALLRRLAKRCPGIGEMRFFHCRFDLASCEPFSGLRRLIVNETVIDATQPFVLPALAELAATDSQMDLHSQTHLLSPKHVPSLRAVSFPSLFDRRAPADPPPLAIDLLLPFLQHLDTFSCDLHCLERYPQLRNHPRILLEHELDPPEDAWDEDGEWVLPLPRLEGAVHIRLHVYCSHVAHIPASEVALSEDGTSLLPSLEAFREALDTQQVGSLQSIYLPSNFRPPSGDTTPFFGAVSGIIAACRRHGVEVVFEPPWSFRSVSIVSREFWQRCTAKHGERGGGEAAE
ncbi:hypothetical protein JCM10213_002274 [Rhodosporidiobolus nylandii]